MKHTSTTNQELLEENVLLKQRIKELEQSVSDLKINEQRFRNLSEASLEAVVFSEDGIIFDANKALNRLFGYEGEELIGKSAADFIAPEKRPFTIEKMLTRTEGAYETLGLKKDGTTFPIEVIPREFEYKGKQFRISVVRDLTEHKQAEEKLKENKAAIQKKLKAIIEPEGDLGTLELADIVDKDLFRRIMEGFHRITGIASAIIDIHGEVLVGVGWQDICSKFHRCHHETLQNCIESDTILAQDVMPGTFKTYLCKNNLVDMATPIMLKDKHLGNFFIGQYLYDDDSHDVSMFIRQARRYGFNEEDYLAAYMRVPRFKKETADAIMSFYFEFTKMITDLSFNNIQLARSLAERKTAAEALSASEQRYLELVTNANSVILRMDSTGCITFFNEFAQRLFGYTEDEVLGLNVVGTIVPETDSAGRDLRSMILDIARQPSLYAQNENENMRRDGSRVWISWTNTPVFNAVGEILEILCIGNDITERKRAEEQLKESEDRFSRAIAGTGAGLWDWDIVNDRVYFSPQWKTMLGYEDHEVEDNFSGWKNLWHPEDAARIERAVNDYLQGRTSVYEIEHRLRHKDGSWHWILTRGDIEKDAAGKPVRWTGTNIDITERKLAEQEKRILEDRLQQADKMKSIGTLAGGIAHDFNNLLMGIQGYASLMLLDLDQSHPFYEKLKRIEEQVQSGAYLAGQLLGFARGGRYEVKTADMNDVIKKTSSMFARTRKEITIRRKYAKDLWNVDVDQGQMEQVFMNLYINAWQAMPGGGELHLETENVIVDDRQAISHEVEPGMYIKISATDNGTGMDEETRKRIFDPFFTTKEMGRGTGLGLATVYGIIKGHKGFINVYSEPGRGTTFNVYLPASEKEVVKERTPAGTIVKGTETILLVDDEQMVLDVCREILRSLGYRVYAAGSGQEAIDVYTEKRSEIDLVILDMIMPGLSGSETFDHLRKLNPLAKIILSSGYSINGQAQEIMDKGCNGFIQKPFQLQKLSDKIRKMFDRE